MGSAPLLLIWDIDGTLIHTHGAGRRALERAFFDMYGHADAFSKVDMAGAVDHSLYARVCSEYNLVPEPEAFFATYANVLRDMLAEQATDARLPGVSTLLETLSSMPDVLQVLGTGNVKAGAQLKLESIGLWEIFETGGYSERAESRQNIIGRARDEGLARYPKQIEKECIWVIGDTPHDVACAHFFGFSSLAVATGAYSEEQLIACGAGHVVSSFEDTIAIVDILTK